MKAVGTSAWMNSQWYLIGRQPASSIHALYIIKRYTVHINTIHTLFISSPCEITQWYWACTHNALVYNVALIAPIASVLCICNHLVHLWNKCIMFVCLWVVVSCQTETSVMPTLSGLLTLLSSVVDVAVKTGVGKLLSYLLMATMLNRGINARN